jgi:hypothetical protein
MTPRTLFGASLVLVTVLLGPRADAAGEAGTHGAADSGTTTSRERAVKVVEARASFERGLKLFDEGKFAEARDAFQHAYDLAPSYRLLYNIGLSAKELGDYAGAIRMLEGYLTEGTWEITAEKGSEIAALIGELIHKVGTNKVTTNVPGAQLFVDGVFAGQTPLEEPLVMNPGKHTIEARAKGYESASRSVTAAPGETGDDIALELAQPAASSSTALMVAASAVVLVGIGAVVMRRRGREAEAPPAKKKSSSSE